MLLISRVYLLCLFFAAAASPVTNPVHPVLTRINATNAVGMTIVASATGLTLETLDGSVAKTFPCDGMTLKIASTKTQWSVKDKRGAGILITDTSKHYLAVVNRGVNPLAVTKIGAAITPIALPVHALTIVNGIKAPVEINSTSGASASKTWTMKTFGDPLTMVCPYLDAHGKTVDSSVGVFAAHTDFGLSPTPAR